MTKMFKGVTSTVLAALLGTGLCFGTRAQAAAPTAQERMQSELQRSCGPALASAGCLAGDIGRVQLAGDVYEYSFKLKAGPGPHDVIGLHRVVREAAPWVPARAAKSLFMVHGDAWGFDAAFRPAATFLAGEGVDVWGIDLRWVNVPDGTTDFTFMKDWNLGTDARDVRVGLAVARLVRWFGGHEDGRMKLLGWSRGAVIAYATANLETQLPPALRHVGGLIPVDMAVKFSPEDAALRDAACARYQAGRAAYLGGQYEGGLLGPAPGAMVRTVGFLAATDPNGVVANPPLTNRQTALFLGAATFAALGAASPVPTYHHFAGQLDPATQLPTALTWTAEPVMFDLLQKASTYQSFAEVVDTEAIACGTEGGAADVPYDDHFAEIEVPVLHVGAAGGFGVNGLYTLSLLGSTDKTVHLVQLLPPEARLMDYGHSDLWMAGNARQEVWTPLLQWIRAR